MADRVEIEIPGIGLIEAKNAATEATLQEILKALKGIEDNTEEEAKNSKKSGNAGAGAAGAAGMAAGLGAAASAAAAMGASLGLAGKAAAAMGKAVGLAGKGVGFGAGVAVAGLQNVSRAALSTSLSLMSLGHTAINLANDLAGMGDKISDAVNLTSNALRSLPGIFGAIGGLVGAAFTAAVGSAERMVGAYQTAASVGATFGGNLNSLNAAASAAGMTMDNFAKLLANNANSLVYLGGTTDGGARRFADLSKTMRNSQIGAELSRMGFTTEQVNSGMAEFVGMIGRTGAIQNMTTQDIAKSSGAYLKDLDALRRLTGESAAQQKAANDKLMADAQFRAAMLGKDAETQKAMMAYINSLPENLRDGAKEMLATGQVTSEAGIAFAAALPKAAGEAMSYGRDLKAGGKLTMDQSLRARNNLIEESKVRQDLLKDQAMYNKELQPTLLGVMDAAASSQKSYAELQREQAKAAKEKNLAQAVEDFRKRIAEISNTFTALLANSGMFDLFAQVFENVVSIVSTFVIPAIKALFGAIQAVIPPIIDTLVPIINDYVIPAFQILGEWISTAVVPIFQKVGAILTDLFAPAIESGVNVVEDIFEPALYAISDFIEDNLEPIMLVLGAAIASTLIPAILKQAATLLLTNAPMLLLVGAVTGAWTIMKKFGVDLTVVGDALRWTGSWIETFFLQIKKGFYTFLDSLPGVSMTKELEEVNQQIKDNEKDREKIEKDIADRRKANLEAEAAKEAERAARDEGRAKARDAREQQALERKMKREMGAIDDKEKREKEAAGGVDMTSPTAMLESFSRQQNGFFAERIDGARQEQKVRLETAAANKQMAEAEQKYAQAKTAEEKRAALEEIVAIQKRINAIQEGNKEISRPGAAQAPSVAPTKLPAGSQVTGLGAVAAHFEAGGKAGTVSTGHGDFGGKSYGAFQLSSKTGDVQKFLDKSGYAAQFKGMEVGSKEFDAKWKELGATKEFAQAQAAHAKTTHYDPQMQKLSKAGLDMSGRGAGVQEAIMSTANQYGANTDVIMKALKDKDTSKMSDKDIINAIQDYKAETVKTRFKSSSAAVQAGVAKRIEQERAMLLGVDGGAVQADVRKADQAKEQKGKPPESKPAKETTPKLDPKLANDWAYSVFVGKNSMSQVPKPYLDEVGKILAKPPANWVSAPKTPEAKVETAQTEQGKPPQQKPVEEVKPKLGGKAVQNWAYAVFEGKITLGQVPQMYRDQVAEVLKNPPADWIKSPGEAKPAKPLGAESESAQAATPTNEEFKINGKQVSKEEFDAYMKANPQAAKMMDMAKQMSGGNGPSVDLMKSMGGILPVGSDLPAESILGKETFATTFDPLSDTSLDAIAPMAESKLGSTDALTSAEGFKQTMSEDAATKMAEEQKARKAMFDMMGRTDVEGSVMQRAGRAGGAGGGEKAKDPVELLNSKLEQLIMINQNIANLNSDQLRVQKNFNTGDVYNSAG